MYDIPQHSQINKEMPSRGVDKYINTFRFYLYTLQNIKFLALPVEQPLL